MLAGSLGIEKFYIPPLPCRGNIMHVQLLMKARHALAHSHTQRMHT